MSAEWIRKSLKIEPSEFGCRVADVSYPIAKARGL